MTPMLVPPVPWSGFFTGGFTHLKHGVVRSPRNVGARHVYRSLVQGVDDKLHERGFVGSLALLMHPSLQGARPGAAHASVLAGRVGHTLGKRWAAGTGRDVMGRL